MRMSLKETETTHRDTQGRRPGKDRGRDAATSQGMPEAPEAKRDKKKILP